MEQPSAGALAPPLDVRTQGTDRSLEPGPSYTIGRGPDCDIVIDDARVSRRHAVLRLEGGRWVLADSGSTNGIYAGDRRVDRIEIAGTCLVRLGNPVDGLLLSCAVSDISPNARSEQPTVAGAYQGADQVAGPASVQAAVVSDGGGDEDSTLEIPYAVRWLVPRGERFANFDLLNDNDTQLDYYRRFGHVYAVGIPTKKWRIVVVSDPELLDEVAANEEQFGKRVEEINFFSQLANSRGGGISVIGDGEHTEQIRRVMLPWYAPLNQRTQFPLMKDQARKLVAAWSALPDSQPIDARSWMERYTLEVSGRGACSYDFGLLDGTGEPHLFATAVPESTKESILRVAEPRPDFTLFAGRAKRARRKRYRRHNEELFAHGRCSRARPDAHLPDGAADGSAQPPGEHARSRDGRVPRPADHARPDPHAPVERLQRAVDHGRLARLRARHASRRRGEADRRDRRHHRRRPGLRPAATTTCSR